MVRLEITGACKDCPFMELEIKQPVYALRCDGHTKLIDYTVICKYETRCDRETKQDAEKF